MTAQQGVRQRWSRRVRHSLQARLVLLFLALAIATTAVFVLGGRAFFANGWQDFARPLLIDYLDRVAADLGSPPDVARARAMVQRLPVSIRIEGPTVNWNSHPARIEYRYRDDLNSPRDDDGGMNRLLSRRTADGHVIRFGLGDWRWHGERSWVIWATLGGLLGLTALAYAVVRRLLRPLADIGAGAMRFAQGDFAQPIQPRRRDELGDLAQRVNHMASSLQQMLEGQRGLLLAISHELRSPLTRARLNAELVAEGPERDALLRDLAQMRDQIADLLEGERLAAGASALQTAPCDPNALVRSAVAEGFADQAVWLHLAEDLPSLQLDAVRLRLLLRNLLDNAQRHGGGAGIEISTWLQADGLLLRVRDHGPGVPAELIPRLAEPFFRPDAARTRAAGGVGLGLYLCRLVARSHGGSLDFANAEPGLAVTLRLPLTTQP